MASCIAGINADPSPRTLPPPQVAINRTKPRKGCFEVTVSGSEEPVLSLLDMPRPFSRLKALDMEDVVESVKKVAK